MKKSELTKQDISKIINLYTSKEISSTHKIAKIFGVGHKKISNILKDNNIDINKKGGQIKYGDVVITQDRVDEELLGNGKKIVAICKSTGKVFNDFANKSGTLVNHIKNIYQNIEIPTQYKRNRVFKTTGRYWHEDFFILKENDLETKPTRKCRYCEWETTDVGNKSGYYEIHLNKIHNISLEGYLNEYPEDIVYHQKYGEKLKRNNYLSNIDNHVLCEVCGEKFSVITNTHLKKHDLTMKKYCQLFGTPKITSNSVSKVLSDKIKYLNENVIKPNYISKDEKEVGDFLKSLGVNIITQDRKILKGKELDIVLPEHNICIEYNGVMWHSEDFGSKDLNYHLNKTLLSNFAGYGLIHLFSDEWLTKKELVKNKLKHILNKSQGFKIGARKCEIKPIDFHLKNDFMNMYHIQGEDLSPINYGAYYDNILVGVMSFTNNRGMNKGVNDSSVFVLNRFATSSDYVINGLANKLLKRFINDYNPKKIISFADRRWTLDSSNNLYTKLGFEHVGNTKQSYYYFKRTNSNDRFHKFRFSKKKMVKKYGFDNSMTEWEMVKELGFDRIWDCGLFKYELNF